MTNREALLAAIQIDIPPFSADKALIDAEINKDAEYVKASEKVIDIAAIAVLQGLLPLSSISEGGFSYSLNRDGMLARLSFLSAKHGITPVTGSVRPKIRARHVW